MPGVEGKLGQSHPGMVQCLVPPQEISWWGWGGVEWGKISLDSSPALPAPQRMPASRHTAQPRTLLHLPTPVRVLLCLLLIRRCRHSPLLHHGGIFSPSGFLEDVVPPSSYALGIASPSGFMMVIAPFSLPSLDVVEPLSYEEKSI